MTAKTEPIREGDIEEWDIEDLRCAIGAQLFQLRILADNLELDGSIDIDTRDILLDLSYKLESVLRCRSNCHCVDPLKDAHDLARDIANIAREVRAHDIALIGERVARLIRDYVWEYEEPWESDE
ncbi:MAG: hypothetical protein RXS42_08995 [Nitrososphaeria archaeon]